jgi:hypothetical protein
MYDGVLSVVSPEGAAVFLIIFVLFILTIPHAGACAATTCKTTPVYQ